mmetsp:Transcript_5382/g.6504  ORF Transcript_5382/g.6504 Transcript_5382/m.6504 type:complete len:314 (-) Transcript_5382:179-1120(-)
MEALHRVVYPPTDRYYYYRGGTVDKGSKVGNLLFSLACGWILSLETVSQVSLLIQVQLFQLIETSLWFSLFAALVSGLFTGLSYHLWAQHLTNLGDQLWKTKDGRLKTKIQPGKDPGGDLKREAVLFGNLNAFLVGVFGTGMFILHVRCYRWSSATIAYRGLLRFYLDCLLTFFWLDFTAYWMHRLLHTKSLYKHLHKWHHRYNVPTAHSAFASHPVDFLVFQAAGLGILVFNVNVIAFLLVSVITAYLNVVKHAGIKFTGEYPWTPTPDFHDDHHSRFTANFGFDLILWDYMFGTLRRKGKTYSETTFADSW